MYKGSPGANAQNRNFLFHCIEIHQYVQQNTVSNKLVCKTEIVTIPISNLPSTEWALPQIQDQNFGALPTLPASTCSILLLKRSHLMTVNLLGWTVKIVYWISCYFFSLKQTLSIQLVTTSQSHWNQIIKLHKDRFMTPF